MKVADKELKDKSPVSKDYRIIWIWLGFAVFWLSVGAVREEVLKPEKLQTSFHDPANFFDVRERERIASRLADFEIETSSRIVVAIYPRGPENSIANFTIRSAELSSARNRLSEGAILFVFMADRIAQLEVSYNLEGELTDATARRILEANLVPQFERGDYVEGIDSAVTAILGTVRDAYKHERLPGMFTKLFRQIKGGWGMAEKKFWPFAREASLEMRIAISFFGGLIANGIWRLLLNNMMLFKIMGKELWNWRKSHQFGSEIKSIIPKELLDSFKALVAIMVGIVPLWLLGLGGGFGGGTGALVYW